MRDVTVLIPLLFTVALMLSVLFWGRGLWQRWQGAPNYAVIILFAWGFLFEIMLVVLMITDANPTLIQFVKLLSNGCMILLLLYLCFLFRPSPTKRVKYSLFLLLILETLFLTDSLLSPFVTRQ